MAIREQGYRHWEGTYTGHAFRWWTILRASLRATVYTKGRLFLLLALVGVAWIFGFFLGMFYFFGGPGTDPSASDLQGRLDPDNFLRGNLYEMLLSWQWMWGVIFSAVVGSRLVSNDLRSDALYIYLAKPLRRMDYVIGKFLACLLWLIPVTLAPALWVYVAANGADNKLLKLHHADEIFWEILSVYGLFIILCAACSVAISSFTKRWTIALIGWIGAIFLLLPIANISADATNKPNWLYLSPANDLWIFAQHQWHRPVDPRFTPDWVPALWILIGLIVAATTAFGIRVARLEVSE